MRCPQAQLLWLWPLSELPVLWPPYTTHSASLFSTLHGPMAQTVLPTCGQAWASLGTILVLSPHIACLRTHEDHFGGNVDGSW